MRIRQMIEQNKDIGGWGFIGMVAAFANWSDVITMIFTALIVAAASCLGGYIMKKIIAYGESLVKSGWNTRKTKNNNQ